MAYIVLKAGEQYGIQNRWNLDYLGLIETTNGAYREIQFYTSPHYNPMVGGDYFIVQGYPNEIRTFEVVNNVHAPPYTFHENTNTLEVFTVNCLPAEETSTPQWEIPTTFTPEDCIITIHNKVVGSRVLCNFGLGDVLFGPIINEVGVAEVRVVAQHFTGNVHKQVGISLVRPIDGQRSNSVTVDCVSGGRLDVTLDYPNEANPTPYYAAVPTTNTNAATITTDNSKDKPLIPTATDGYGYTFVPPVISDDNTASAQAPSSKISNWFYVLAACILAVAAYLGTR